MNLTTDKWYVLMDEETGGEGDAGGSLIGDVTSDSVAEGNEGQEGGEGGTPDAAASTEGSTLATGATGEEGKEGEGKDEAQAAPEAYEAFNIPEGMVASEEALETFQNFARENGMSQEHAQKALDYYTGEVQKLFTEQENAWKEVRQGWIQQAKSDEEFGGQKFQENMRHVAKAMDAFGSPELRQTLNESGLGDNPALIRFFYRVGKLAGEGDFLTGRGDTSGDVDPASVLYPSMNK